MHNDLDEKIKNYQGCYDALVTLQADALQTEDDAMSPIWNVLIFSWSWQTKKQMECTPCI